jgi:SAM-dependent methyltransferase
MSIYADFAAAALEGMARPGMRVLEVGGGVGAVLQRCASMLKRVDIGHYCFTDLGQSFVQAAQRAYGGEHRLSFAKVDLDLPLHEQGLSDEKFDVVVAVNVMHVANRLSFSLRQLLSILKPAGHLILSEGSPPDRVRHWRLDIVFGFLRGWWDVAMEQPWRPRPGFLLPVGWEGILQENGFGQLVSLPGQHWFAGPCRGGLIIAQKY